MTGLASKTLVWLAAALLPFEPLSALSCPCAAPSQPSTDVQLRCPTVGSDGDCCRRVKPCCRGDNSLGCCCAKNRRAGATSCCGTGNGCNCRSNDSSSPPIPEVPLESRSGTAGDAAQPPLTVFLSCSDAQMPVGELCAASPDLASGLQCCILLCRFNL